MRIIILFLLLIVSYGHARCQDQAYVDSLLMALPEERNTERLDGLLELYIAYMYHDIEKAREYLEEYQDIAEDLGEPFFKASGYNLAGTYFSYTSDHRKSLENFMEAKLIFEKMEDEERLSAILNNMAGAYRSLGNLEKAMETQFKALQIKEKLEVPKWDLAASYFSLGNLYSDIEDYGASNSWYKKALAIYEDLADNPIDNFQAINLIAYNYYYLDSLELSYTLLDSARQFFAANNYPNDLAGCLDMLGNIEKDRKNYQLAEEYYGAALELAEENGETSLPGLLYRRLARLHMEQSNLDQALVYAQRALDNAEATGMKKKMIGDLQTLSEVWEMRGDYGKALALYKDYAMLKDSILGNEKINAIKDLQLEYEAAKKEKEIELLEERDKRSRMQKRGMIGGIAALLIILILLIYALRERNRIHKLEKEKYDMDLAFKEKELSAFALHLASKNEALKALKAELKEVRLVINEGKREIDRIGRQIEYNLENEGSWEQFRQRFNAVHPTFEKDLTNRYQNLTSNDLRLMSLIKMNLSNKEISNILNLSPDGIKKARYRLRKKLELESSERLNEVVFQL